MGSEIPLNSNFKNISCQLGGLTLNGNVDTGTAQNYKVLTINDPKVINTSGTYTHDDNKFIPIKIGDKTYYLPLYTKN